MLQETADNFETIGETSWRQKVHRATRVSKIAPTLIRISQITLASNVGFLT